MITKLNIADLNVRIDTETDAAAAFCAGFRYDFRCEPDVLISVDPKAVKTMNSDFCTLRPGDAEKLFLLRGFGDNLASQGGVIFTGSIKTDSSGKCLLVLSSGALSESQPGLQIDERLYYAIRKNKDGKYIVYSTPWSSEKPLQCELAGIVIAADVDFVKNDEQSTAEGEVTDLKKGKKITENNWIKIAIHESVTPKNDENFGELIGVLGDLYREIPINVTNNGI